MTDEAERRDAITDAHTTGVAAATSLGESLSRKADRGDIWKAAFVVSCLAVVASISISLAASSQIADLKAERTAEQAKSQVEQERIRQAVAALEEANKDLRQRGQPTIPPPQDLQDVDTLVAAATARVLANLPAAPGPTDVQIGNAVAAYLATNPVRISAYAIAEQVEQYYASNPPAPGPQGEPGRQGEPGVPGEAGKDGQPGHTPTAEEIMAVFNEAAAQNPNLLCSGKGIFTEVRGFVRVAPDNIPQERAFWVCLPQ